MSVRGKSKYDWEYRTLCDFGTPGRKSTIARHYSLAAANNAFKKIRKIYGPDSRRAESFLYRCWQEDRQSTIINDTGEMIYHA